MYQYMGLSMADIDEISMTLGKLMNGQEETLRQTSAIHRRITDQESLLQQVKGVSDFTARSHNDLKAEVDKEIKPALEEIKGLKQRGIGLLAGVGLGGGAGGGALAWVLEKLARHGG